MKAEGFEIEIPETALANRRDRLAQARFAADFANEDWSYGANSAYLRDPMAYWRDGFDWRAQRSCSNKGNQTATYYQSAEPQWLQLKAHLTISLSI